MTQQLDRVSDHTPAVEVAIDELPVGSLKRAIADAGPVLTVQKDFALVFDGENLGDDDAAAAKVIASRVAHAAILYVAAFPSERWTRVQAAVALVPPSVELRLIVTGKQAPVSHREVVSIVEGLQKAAGPCSGVLQAFQDGGAGIDSHRWHRIKREVPDAVAACTCEGVDVEGLTRYMLKLGRDQSTFGWLKLPASPAKVPASATVADVAKRLS